MAMPPLWPWSLVFHKDLCKSIFVVFPLPWEPLPPPRPPFPSPSLQLVDLLGLGNNEFGDNEFARSRREGKKIIQVRCKTHTLNEYFSMVMYPLNTLLTIKKG